MPTPTSRQTNIEMTTDSLDLKLVGDLDRKEFAKLLAAVPSESLFDTLKVILDTTVTLQEMGAMVLREQIARQALDGGRK